MKLYRLMRKLYLLGVPFFPNFLRRLIRIFFAWEVFPSSEIGNNVEFVHGGLGCVIHERSVIEDNVKIYQNVTLGGNGKVNSPMPRVPHVCEGAVIYAGACVLGPVRIGRNSIVGANAVVLCDVPDDCVAVGVPAIIKKKSGDVN